MERSTPEQQNVSSQCILNFLDHLQKKQLELHGLMILRHGYVIAEGWWAPYQPSDPHVCYSLTKSFTSMAVGFAVDEELISLNDHVLDYFPEFNQLAIKSGLSDITVKHLLTMTTGHDLDTTRFRVNRQFLQDQSDVCIGDREDGDWVKGFFELPAKHSPGSHFIYNSGASQTLSAIIRKVTGCHLLDYLQPRLFEPLGISRPFWECNSRGEMIGGWGLRLRTEDIARFGQLLIQKGFWNGKQVLPADWVAEATSRQTSTGSNDYRQAVTGTEDWLQGYGYHFWQCRHDAYRGDGAFGQFCLVMPDLDTVIAMNGGEIDMQAVLDAVWDYLLPELSSGLSNADHNAFVELSNALRLLDVNPTDSQGGNPFDGTAVYLIEPNDDHIDQVRFCFSQENNSLSWSDSTGEYLLNFKPGSWTSGLCLAGEQAACKGTWLDKGSLIIDICRINTPYHDRLLCSFDGNRIMMEYNHADFLPGSRTLYGTLTGIHLEVE